MQQECLVHELTLFGTGWQLLPPWSCSESPSPCACRSPCRGKGAWQLVCRPGEKVGFSPCRVMQALLVAALAAVVLEAARLLVKPEPQLSVLGTEHCSSHRKRPHLLTHLLPSSLTSFALQAKVAGEAQEIVALQGGGDTTETRLTRRGGAPALTRPSAWLAFLPAISSCVRGRTTTPKSGMEQTRIQRELRVIP